MANKKRCPKCKEVKDLSEFGKDSSRGDGLKVYCKVCKAKEYQDYCSRNREKVKEAKRAAYYRRKEKEFKKILNA